jgi:DASS family divalent anion:Na+ symporter
MLLPGLVCLLIMPMVIYLLAPPELKSTPNAVDYARGELDKMGRLGQRGHAGDLRPAAAAVGQRAGHAAGGGLHAGPTVVAFVGLFVLIITGTIDWDDVLSEKSAWDTLVWFGRW